MWPRMQKFKRICVSKYANSVKQFLHSNKAKHTSKENAITNKEQYFYKEKGIRVPLRGTAQHKVPGTTEHKMFQLKKQIA